MIYETGTQAPTPAQRRMVREIADDSFTATLPRDFGSVPVGSKWKHDTSSGIALRMRCVEPHKDDWVGFGVPPKRYAAIFWVVDMPKFEDLIFQVGTVAHRMRACDFVVFDDRLLHSVYARRVWRGCAYQVALRSASAGDNGADQAGQRYLMTRRWLSVACGGCGRLVNEGTKGRDA